MNRDTRQLDLHAFGLEVKRKREARHMTQEQLAQIVNRGSRTIMYLENRGQHTALNVFYQIATMFDISVDQYFFPQSAEARSERRTRIDAMLNALSEKDLSIVEALVEALKSAKEIEG